VGEVEFERRSQGGRGVRQVQPGGAGRPCSYWRPCVPTTAGGWAVVIIYRVADTVSSRVRIPAAVIQLGRYLALKCDQL
jgi:hypothetical protein